MSRVPSAGRSTHVRGLSDGPGLDPTLSVTLNFHPDRLVPASRSCCRLGQDGIYRSQFETGTGNGGLTAHPGGDGGAGRAGSSGAPTTTPAGARPKYGALNLHRRGSAPRPLRVGPLPPGRARARADDLLLPDSVFEPELFGTARLSRSRSRCRCASAADHDLLDDYVEAHVHGLVDLARDVEALVLDPRYRGTESRPARSGSVCPSSGTRATGSRRDPARPPGLPRTRVVALGEPLAEDGALAPRLIGDASARAATTNSRSSGSGTTSRASAPYPA